MASPMQRRVGVFVSEVIVLISAASSRAQQGQQSPSQGRWVKLAPMPLKNEEFVFGVANSKLYVLGGNGDGPTGLVQEYDPAADKWTRKKDVPTPMNHMGVTEYRGKLYVFGGGGEKGVPLNNSWEYDPVADTWKPLAPMPTRRQSPVAAEVGGKIYVIGGAGHHPNDKDPAGPIGPNSPHRALDTNEVYDVATNTWATRMTMPTARHHAAVGVVNGKIYVLGGRLGAINITGASSPTNIVEVYDPAADLWGAAGLRMPNTRTGFGFATYRGRIFIVGGETYDDRLFSVVRAVDAYDPATNRWEALPTLPMARHGVNVGVIGNRLIVAGGHIQSAGTAGAAAHSDETDAFEFNQ
jgi:N-acetylneuraminic acid mutarotase